MLRLLTGKEGAPLPSFEAVSPTPGMTETQIGILKSRVNDVKKSIKVGAYQDALERFHKIADHLWQRGGPQMLLLKGYLHYANAHPEDTTQCEEAITVLSRLVREHPDYVAVHPESYFYLSLCHDNALHFDKAVKNIRTYVSLMETVERQEAIAKAQAAANLEAALRGLTGTMSIPLPKDAEDAPTTDAEGEASKQFW